MLEFLPKTTNVKQTGKTGMFAINICSVGLKGTINQSFLDKKNMNAIYFDPQGGKKL